MACALRDDYEVLFSSSDYGNFVEDMGFSIIQIEGISVDEVMSGARAFDFGWINHANLERVFRSQVEGIRKHRPLAVVGDAVITLRMAAEYTCTPHLALINGYMSRYYGVPRRLPRVHPARKYASALPPQLFNNLVKLAEKAAFRITHRPFRKLRMQYKLQSRFSFLQEFEGNLNLIVDSPVLFPQKKLPQNFRIIGPLYHSENKPEPEIIKMIHPEKKTILITMGSTGDWERLGFLTQPFLKKFNIILSGKHRHTINESNIYSREFINHSAILDRVDLVICQGGNGSIYQALAYGVPILCIPSIFEHEWNTQRVVELGYGDEIYLGESPVNIQSKIEYWSKQKQMPGFREIRKVVSAMDAPQNFRKELHAYLERRAVQRKE
ncbi:hypothetical protein JW877_06030 [bacterium]|nr:hypothetical protein [bacterium]